MKKATAVVVMAVLSLVAACAPAAPTPTPTPEPAPTPVWILASEPEHLEGIWILYFGGVDLYHSWDAEGTVWQSRDPKHDTPNMWRRFWFEEGVYYEESPGCPGIGVYEAHLEIRGGRAVRLRMKVIKDTREMECTHFPAYWNIPFLRVD